jgi:hypothetical protein
MATIRDAVLSEAAAPAETREAGFAGAIDGMARTSGNWNTANQRYLRAALNVVRAYLTRSPDASEGEQEVARVQLDLQAAANAMSSPSALDALCIDFGLTPFERDVLLLCAGLELDAGFGPLFAAAHGDPQRSYPTFSLALAALPDPHWSALAPEAALRRWRLIEVGAGSALVFSPLRIDERVLHYLLGVNYLDDRLLGIVDRVQPAAALTPSQDRLAERIAELWSQPARDAALPAVQLCGAETTDKRGVAVAACRKLGCDLCVVSAQNLPADPRELEALMRLWEREAILSRAVVLLDCDELDATDAVHAHAVARFVEGVGGLIILTGRERRVLRQRPLISFDVVRPTVQEQRRLWQQTLGATAVSLNGHVETLVAQFSLNAMGIRSAAAEIAGQPVADESRELDARLGDRLWDACRAQSRPRLDELAHRIASAASWDDLVLPELQRQTLRDVVVQVRHRAQVYEQWGFAAKSSRGLGISALFAGASGTGKTLAAEVLANELRLDLYRIDLSQVVSKYIGETEKNLRRVFDAAEDGGAVLLFDEADALFGKRSEVKDSHDRYANIEVSYLLQRMEAYRGLAILTSNMKDALDTAFLRRIRFVVTFPFPDGVQRAEIWRRIFPAATPTDGVDVARLAQLNVTGGNIRNIALNAAFLAADAGTPVTMPLLLAVARAEFRKLEKPINEADFRL